MTDAFTLRHLAYYVDESVWDDEREAFMSWVLAQLADDPTVADVGWSSLYRSWSAEFGAGPFHALESNADWSKRVGGLHNQGSLLF